MIRPDPMRTRLDDALSAYDLNTTSGFGAGWQNEVTGYGTARDKTMYSQFKGYLPLDLVSLSNLYHGSDLAARVIDVVAEEEFRLPYKLSVCDDKIDEQLAAKLDLLELDSRALDSRVWGRLFGGCALVYGAEDGRSAASPLRLESVRSLDFLTVVDRRFLWPVSWYSDGPKAGTPEIYTVANTWTGVVAGSYQVHESRMVKFPGVRTGRRERLLNASWDYSVLDKVIPQIRMLDTIYRGVEILVTDGPQGVYRVKGLMDQIMAGNEKLLMKRFEIADMYRSVLRAVLIDADAESFERQQITYSGLPDIMVQMQRRLSSAVQIPIMVLFGQTPVGLNGNSDNDIRWFYDVTAKNQRTILAPRLKQVAAVALASMGHADLIPKLEIEFAPLWQPSALEIAQERAAIAQGDATYLQNQVFTPEEVALSRVDRKGRWSKDWTGVDREVRVKMLDDIVKNLAAGSEPGMPGQEIGRTPQVGDVRGMGDKPEVLGDPNQLGTGKPSVGPDPGKEIPVPVVGKNKGS
jgi:phage-related protein (TIGR01555 family)